MGSDTTIDLKATWTVTSFHRGPYNSHDEMIIEFRKKASWWARHWYTDDRGKDKTWKIAFVGRSFEWFQQPRYTPVTDITTKYRLYDLWFEQTRTSLFRD